MNTDTLAAYIMRVRPDNKEEWYVDPEDVPLLKSISISKEWRVV